MAVLLLAPWGTRAAEPIASMRGERRVVVVSAPGPRDGALDAQRRILAGWREAAAARDVTVVEVVGGRVEGADETADGVRRRYGMPEERFAIVLIGKDGHVALRAGAPVSGAVLTDVIDAMPMRRAGLR
ncbi:MAG: DUF4174 domain-containing protein [Gluconacetobacter diazotrophicus]|nr:DUF4174 domain-containing protein [Gluconacetobacter diazotrophicus]